MTLLLFQITVVLLTALLCGAVARKLGQARVVGEIAGGILLGPSVMGRLAPYISERLFPANSLVAFDVLSTVGLVLFLFLIGTDLDLGHLQRQGTTATLASLSGIAVPFCLSAAVTPWLYEQFSPVTTPLLTFGLFLGICMSITAFPVLASILRERNLQRTPLGATALLCAAVDDVSAWLLLAFALTLLPHHESQRHVWQHFTIFALYLLIMLGVFRPLGRWLGHRFSDAPLTYELCGVSIGFPLLSAAITDALGMHALFGAFVAGLCFPRIQAWLADLRSRLDTLISLLLLPLFFALTGIRTRLDLLHGATVWTSAVLILVVAVAGKVGGAVLGARLTGQSWQDALALGALLNTRGLVELIVLNIAYNAHIFSPTLFALLVLMALLTTAMTTPLLNFMLQHQERSDAKTSCRSAMGDEA